MTRLSYLWFHAIVLCLRNHFDSVTTAASDVNLGRQTDGSIPSRVFINIEVPGTSSHSFSVSVRYTRRLHSQRNQYLYPNTVTLVDQALNINKHLQYLPRSSLTSSNDSTFRNFSIDIFPNLVEDTLEAELPDLDSGLHACYRACKTELKIQPRSIQETKQSMS